MENADRLLKNFLKERISKQDCNRSILLCPSEERLIEYIDGAIEDDTIGRHISDCPDCLKLIMLVKETGSHPYENIEGPSKTINDRIKALALNKSHTLRKNWFKKNVWIILSLGALSLSFVFPKHFLQFLALSIILGAKWVFDTATTRTMIIIYETLKKQSRLTSDREDIKIRKS